MAWLTPLHPSDEVVETSLFLRTSLAVVFFASMVDVVYTPTNGIGLGMVPLWSGEALRMSKNIVDYCRGQYDSSKVQG